jgi:hypothetical protein
LQFLKLLWIKLNKFLSSCHGKRGAFHIRIKASGHHDRLRLCASGMAQGTREMGTGMHLVLFQRT